MMIKEFVERTGFEPTAEEYGVIEENYINYGGDKDAYCKNFTETNQERYFSRRRAEKIEELKSRLAELDKQFKAELDKRDARIAELEAELDAELEWKPYDKAGTQMSRGEYERLAAGARIMNEQEAKEFIAKECGFDVDKIRLRTKVNTCMKNRHNYIRAAETFERNPAYEATDWNYVRFDCGFFSYEFINGQLYFYTF